MSSLAARLRGVLRVRDAATPVPVTPAVDAVASQTASGGVANDDDGVARVLGGVWRGGRGRRYLVVEREYGPGYRHGDVCVADVVPDGLGWPGVSVLAGGAGAASDRDDTVGRVLFLDLETTGLAGGAGTCAFLVGCGWFEAGGFRIRQYFLADPAGERPILEDLTTLVTGAQALGTFNGKSFDLPLIEMRFAFNRLQAPFAALPHVDMLHHARRLWRDDLGGGCRLGDLERTLCGHARQGDVPGFEIPERYFQFVRSRDAGPLRAVLEHNRLDLLSLALVMDRAVRLVRTGASATSTGREAFGLGRIYERAGLTAEAALSYEQAGNCETADASVRASAWRLLAILHRKARRHEAAAAAWRRALELRDCPPLIAREASEALAVHHEHRVRDLDAARRFAMQTLGRGNQPGADAARHRLARLDRKIGCAPDGAPLF